MVQNLTHTTYNTTYHTRCTKLIKDTMYILKLSFAWKSLLNKSQCTTKPINDVCHVVTLIRLKCDKYSVINCTHTSWWYGMVCGIV